MSFPAGVVTFPTPAFRTIEEAQAWAELVTGWAVGFQLAYNAHLAQTRFSKASAITSPTDLTDNSGGTANATIQDVPAAYDEGALANNFADLAAAVNTLNSTVRSILATLRTNNLVAS